jgi:hypothetical protein
METVIEALMNSVGSGVKRKPALPQPIATSDADVRSRRATVPDLIKPPDLTQARVNKCLVALVNRKIVAKDNTSVRVHGWPGGFADVVSRRCLSQGTMLYRWQGLPV